MLNCDWQPGCRLGVCVDGTSCWGWRKHDDGSNFSFILWKVESQFNIKVQDLVYWIYLVTKEPQPEDEWTERAVNQTFSWPKRLVSSWVLVRSRCIWCMFYLVLNGISGRLGPAWTLHFGLWSKLLSGWDVLPCCRWLGCCVKLSLGLQKPYILVFPPPHLNLYLDCY